MSYLKGPTMMTNVEDLCENRAGQHSDRISTSTSDKAIDSVPVCLC